MKPGVRLKKMSHLCSTSVLQLFSSCRYASHMLVPQHALQQDEVREAFSHQSGAAAGLPVVAADGKGHTEDGPPGGDGGPASHRIIAVFEQPVLADFQVSPLVDGPAAHSPS